MQTVTRLLFPSLTILLVSALPASGQSNDLVNRNTPGNGKQLFGSERNRQIVKPGGGNPIEGPFGLKPSSVKFDKDQIKSFVDQVAGAPDGPIEESELEELLDQLEQRFGVQIPDRDVILVSGVTAKGLIDAVQKSVVDKNVGDDRPDHLFRKSDGSKAPWSELSLPEKQAILVQLQNGKLQLFQNPESDNLRVTDRRYSTSGDRRGFYPNGNQETSAYAMTYNRNRNLSPKEKAMFRGEYTRIMSSLAAQREFYKNGPSEKLLESIEGKNPERKGFYSNGRARFDSRGNEVYANGARKKNDKGVPLYSNGRPKVNDLGQQLFSNGLRKTTDDGKLLYADGSLRRTADGVELFRNGNRKWTGDGRMPGGYDQQRRNNSQAEVSTNGVEQIPRDNAPLRSDAQESVNRATYSNGRPQVTDQGVQLHANGKKRFSGDGIVRGVDNRTPSDINSGRKTDFVAELYSNGKRTYNERSDRLYDNGKSRTTNQNAFLYKNGRELTTAGNRALTPTGERVNAISGFQGRPQGKFPVFEIIDGTVVKYSDDRLILRKKGDIEPQTLRVGTAEVARIGDPPVPGTLDQLSPNLAVQAVSRKMVQFVDGELVEEDEEPELYAVLASNPKVGLATVPDGRQVVRSILTGRVKTFGDGKLFIEGRSGEVTPVTISEDVLLQQMKQGTPTPAEIKYITPGRRVSVVAEQVQVYKDGKLAETGPPRALAVIE